MLRFYISEIDDWRIIPLLSMLFLLTWTIIWKPTAPLISVQVLFLVSGRMYLKVQAPISKWSGQTTDIPHRFQRPRSNVCFPAWSGDSNEALLACTVSSHGEAIALRLILWQLSLLWGHVLSISPKHIITKSPERLSTVQQSDRSRITLETNLWECLWGSLYTGLIRWEDPYWCGRFILWLGILDWIKRRDQAEPQHSSLSASFRQKQYRRCLGPFTRASLSQRTVAPQTVSQNEPLSCASILSQYLER